MMAGSLRVHFPLVNERLRPAPQTHLSQFLFSRSLLQRALGFEQREHETDFERGVETRLQVRELNWDIPLLSEECGPQSERLMG